MCLSTGGPHLTLDLFRFVHLWTPNPDPFLSPYRASPLMHPSLTTQGTPDMFKLVYLGLTIKGPPRSLFVTNFVFPGDKPLSNQQCCLIVMFCWSGKVEQNYTESIAESECFLIMQTITQVVK